MNKIAIMYDFDLTLAPYYMQENGLIPRLNISSKDFWDKSNLYDKKLNMDMVLGYMFAVYDTCKEKNIKLTSEFLNQCGENVEFYNGVLEWFENINKYGKKMGFEVEHYIISSGSKEIIEGTKIAKYFKKIFASYFAYDENGEAFWPCQVVNYTTKTQYIFRIRKNLLDDLSDCHQINQKEQDRSILIPFENMIYIGDGETDIPCFKLINEKGGKSLCVYNENNQSQKECAVKIFTDKRVNACARADYSKQGELYLLVTGFINELATKNN